MTRHLRPAVVLLGVFTLTTGLLYPILITVISQALFPYQANGSLVGKADRPVGSAIIGQSFTSSHYFWGRPSATTPPYNASSSMGSNLGPSNPALKDAAFARLEALRKADPGSLGPVPVDLVTSSASGLDPHISPAAAAYQLRRVARVRGLSEDVVRHIVADHTEQRSLGIWGEPRVNVLLLNLALDRLQTDSPEPGP